jgi:hypothetical protein
MFTPPRTGWYNICAYMRFKNSGNANDIVLYKVTKKRKFTTRAMEISLRIIQRSVTEIFLERKWTHIQYYFHIFCRYGMGTGPKHVLVFIHRTQCREF